MHKLTVTLKQHTPLIHFQHDQEGATLRASEVKPKLDKFIIARLTDEQKAEGRREGWMKEKDGKCWLDYKMRIRLDGDDDRQEFLLASYMKQEKKDDLRRNGIVVIDNTSFFAQEKQNGGIAKCPVNGLERKWREIEKKGVLHSSNLIVEITCKNECLTNVLSQNIQSFFVAFNFGTRQSKGFGCFSVLSILLNQRNIPLNSIERLLEDNFLFVYKKCMQTNEISQVISQINEDYRLLKSGRRMPYAKSKLMLYGELNNIRWEKRFIKKKTNKIFETEDEDVYYELKSKPQNKKVRYQDNETYNYLRAMLGLAEQFEFLLENPPHGENKNKMIVKIENQSDIQRYQSPLLVKVFDNNIYFVGNNVDATMLNKRFSFSVTIQEDECWSNEDVGSCDTPQTFSLRDFMRFAMFDQTNNASLGYQVIKQ